MSKDELIDALIKLGEDRDELRKSNKSELEELLENLTDDELMFPNGRDFDAEDW